MVFGVSLEQLERCREWGHEGSCDPIFAGLCRDDAVHTGNVILSRINQAAHWREEFRDMQGADDSCSDDDSGDVDEITPSAHEMRSDGAFVDVTVARTATASARRRARALLLRHIDAHESLQHQLVRRLEQECFEAYPEDKAYRQCCRAIAANLRRNTMLAAGFSGGLVPPQWIVLADTEALATRMGKLQRRAFRCESLKDAKLDDVNADIRRQFWAAARGTDLAPPPQNEDPLD